MNSEKIYKAETGNDAYLRVNDGILPMVGYVKWLENKVEELEQRPEAGHNDTAVSLQELVDSIGWVFHGTGHYYVTMKNCGRIYCTKDADKRDLFIAQLKAKLLTGLSN